MDQLLKTTEKIANAANASVELELRSDQNDGTLGYNNINFDDATGSQFHHKQGCFDRKSKIW